MDPRALAPTDKKRKRAGLPPPPNLFQLNFDGASKGNPSPSGFGGVFRDHTGNLHLIYLGSNGWDTNNSSELEGLWQGLIQAQRHNFFPLIIEGDSQIIINMGKKISQGAPVHKVSKRWRMAHRLDLIQHWLTQYQAVSFQHTVREGNKLADFLANVGVDSNIETFSAATLTIGTEDQLRDYLQLVEKDKPPWKGVSPDPGACNIPPPQASTCPEFGCRNVTWTEADHLKCSQVSKHAIHCETPSIPAQVSSAFNAIHSPAGALMPLQGSTLAPINVKMDLTASSCRHSLRNSLRQCVLSSAQRVADPSAIVVSQSFLSSLPSLRSKTSKEAMTRSRG